MLEKQLQNWSEILIECQISFWIWNTIQYIIYQVFALYVLHKLKGILEFQNRFIIFLFSVCLLIRECTQSFVYWDISDRGQRKFYLEEELKGIYKYRSFQDVFDAITIGVYYIMVFKMLLFWDSIYLKKV